LRTDNTCEGDGNGFEVPDPHTELTGLVPNSTKHPRTAPSISARIATLAALAALVAVTFLEGLLSGPAAAAPARSHAVVPTRHATSSGATPLPRTPRRNRRALRVALNKLGHPYVFGAAGPHAFDCSGLMQYSYRRAGRRIPRIANAQFHAAHRIRRSHLRPGDLVFYHVRGHYGRVFHVGMYVSRSTTVAAVDPAQGVTWQRIHYADATFGSFTHR
jgi:peptidoglycan DL-endopeptidase CwlO